MAAVFVETDGEKAARRPNARSKWKTIGRRVKDEVAKDNLSIIAAGVAFYGFLSIFPALAATVSIYGLVTEPVGFHTTHERYSVRLAAGGCGLGQ